MALPTCEFYADNLKVKMDMTIPADVNRLGGVIEGFMAIVTAMQCACGHEMDVELAMREALANAIVHGAGNDPRRTIECCVACDDVHGMLVVVRDPGEGFDPQTLPNPVVGENVFSEHGRGVFLINQLMDRVEYKRGGTEIHMRKFRQPTNVKNCGL
ncbi:MAG TPA: ATP-binding protein [Terriglobales bacterium]|nr:ATP-binding protein [Terriglobales bacterium]